MKKLIKLSAVIFAFTQLLPKVCPAHNGYSQAPMATYCGTGCPRLTISHVKKTDLGVQNSTVFEITNNLPGQVKVDLFLKRTDGEWVNEGISDPIAQDGSTMYRYNRSDLTGEFCVYYIDFPSNQRFPYPSDVKRMFNHGY